MRGKQAKKREIKPDEIYGSTLVSKMINYVMIGGKKSIAATAVYNAIEQLQQKSKMADPIEALEKAMGNIKPKIEVRSRRVGGANFQVPMPVSESRQIALALRWVISAARAGRKTSTFGESLARELINSFNNEGSAVKKKEEVHRMAEANKAFAQFAQY